jgi:6-phosphogluconolactonase
MLPKRFESTEEAAQALAQHVAAALRDAVDARGVASLLVPGGRTPVTLFRVLRRIDLPWAQVGIGLTDERWVASDHADSNERLVRCELLADAAAAARFVPLHNGAGSAAHGAQRAWHNLASLHRPYDAVVLGMGDDGHFASLFPGSPGVAAALDPLAAPACVAMRAPGAPFDRISLNLAALAQSRQLSLFISGERKLALLQSAASRERLPVDALLALARPRPIVYWAP